MVAKTIEVDLALLGNQVEQNAALLSKLDVAIEKISESNQNVSKMLAVHEERIHKIEKFGQEAASLIERKNDRIKQEIDQMQKEIEKKIDDSNTHVKKYIDDLRLEIKTEFSGQKTAADVENKAIKARLDSLEKWRWILTGAAFVIGFIISKFETILKLFH